MPWRGSVVAVHLHGLEAQPLVRVVDAQRHVPAARVVAARRGIEGVHGRALLLPGEHGARLGAEEGRGVRVPDLEAAVRQQVVADARVLRRVRRRARREAGRPRRRRRGRHGRRRGRRRPRRRWRQRRKGWRVLLVHGVLEIGGVEAVADLERRTMVGVVWRGAFLAAYVEVRALRVGVASVFEFLKGAQASALAERPGDPRGVTAVAVSRVRCDDVVAVGLNLVAAERVGRRELSAVQRGLCGRRARHLLQPASRGWRRRRGRRVLDQADAHVKVHHRVVRAVGGNVDQEFVRDVLEVAVLVAIVRCWIVEHKGKALALLAILDALVCARLNV